MATEEQECLLKNVYVNEKEPETKTSAAQTEDEQESVVEGVPLHPSNQTPSGAVSPSSTSRWSTSLLACLGNNDEFFSSDLEVCILGSCAPCLLYASNVERLYPVTENTFTNHLLSYSGLLCLGNLIFGCNALAPCLSCGSRSEIRKKYNLMGTGECMAKSCGCGTCYMESEHRECIDSAGDFAIHYLCNPCALCQEGREIRRRMPHPGFIRSYMPMNAPSEQAMHL